jgi:hypothetical protein
VACTTRRPAVHALSPISGALNSKSGLSLSVLTALLQKSAFAFYGAKGIRQCQRVTKSHSASVVRRGAPDYGYCSSASRFFPPLDSSETRAQSFWMSWRCIVYDALFAAAMGECGDLWAVVNQHDLYTLA